jgi:hypothetical protein
MGLSAAFRLNGTETDAEQCLSINSTMNEEDLI